MKEYMKQLFTAPRSRRAMFFLLFAAAWSGNSLLADEALARLHFVLRMHGRRENVVTIPTAQS